MSLYDDFKKQKETGNKPKVEKKKEEVKSEVTSGNISEDTQSNEVSQTNQSQEINVDGEVYKIVNIPFYKKKEFYGVIVAAIASLVILFILLYTPSFKMEDLEGKTETYAKSYAETYDLNLTPRQEYNSEVEKGKIFQQSLEAGKDYKEGSVLEIVISMGPNYEEVITYPDFSTMTYEEAKNWKEENKAIGTEIIQESNAGVEVGGFIKEELDSNSDKGSFKRSSKTKIYYSTGPKPVTNSVTVADFKGKTVQEAAVWARENGVKFSVTEIYDEYLTPNVIVEQSVAPGAKIDKGATLTVTMSVGPGVKVPSFNGLDAEQAATQGVKVSVDTVYHASVEAGKLISQSKPAGTIVGAEDEVKLKYSLGMVPIGSYVGMTEPEVVSALNEINKNGANLRVYYVEWDISSAPEGTVQGTVASQDIINKLVAPGTVLTVAIYR